MKMNSTNKFKENCVNINKKNKFVTRLIRGQRKVTPTPLNKIDNTLPNNDNLNKDAYYKPSTIVYSTISTLSQNSPPNNNVNANNIGKNVISQFGLCCTSDNRSATPPEKKLTVRCKSLPHIDLKNISNEVVQEHLEITDMTPQSENHKYFFKNYNSESTHHNLLDKCERTSNLKYPMSNSNQDRSQIIRPPFHRSIAMAACRSRLRANMLANDNLYNFNPPIAVAEKLKYNSQEVLTNPSSNMLNTKLDSLTEKARKRLVFFVLY